MPGMCRCVVQVQVYWWGVSVSVRGRGAVPQRRRLDGQNSICCNQAAGARARLSDCSP